MPLIVFLSVEGSGALLAVVFIRGLHSGYNIIAQGAGWKDCEMQRQRS